MNEEIEEEAGEVANRFLTLIEAGERTELKSFIDTLDADNVVFALFAVSDALLRQEAINRSLAKDNTTLNIANKTLFDERGKLLATVAELREIQSDQASMLSRLRMSAA